jgi:hypothetical protein
MQLLGATTGPAHNVTELLDKECGTARTTQIKICVPTNALAVGADKHLVTAAYGTPPEGRPGIGIDLSLSAADAPHKTIMPLRKRSRYRKVKQTQGI